MAKLNKQETIDHLAVSIIDHCCGTDVEIGVAQALIEQALMSAGWEADERQVTRFFKWLRGTVL